ncbi:hypothetical protein GUJ93_ZPchr0015g6835 [Zizania palustris]|uniref:Uncharacterized protein n=1 Tax=Zizania palustris TaxID=103762 RepID=A0A8J5TLX0_ZIZPA|nr:hypothetical protein GUJ93_ZPchr0015g6835 [Zizania palustris]
MKGRQIRRLTPMRRLSTGGAVPEEGNGRCRRRHTSFPGDGGWQTRGSSDGVFLVVGQSGYGESGRRGHGVRLCGSKRGGRSEGFTGWVIAG